MPFTIRQTQELLTSQSGLALVGALLEKTQYKYELDHLPMPANRGETLLNSDIASAMVGLLVQGKCDFDNIEPHRKDTFFPLALNLTRTPSAPILRQRLDKATDRWDQAAQRASIKLLSQHAVQTACYKEYIPIDIDVSPFDNSKTQKEGVSRTYKEVDGFAPIFAYIGREGYMLNVELREGKQHSQKGAPQFLQETLSSLKKLPHQHYLVRMDAGHHASENVDVIDAFNKEQTGKHVDYIIKRNLRRESKEQWLKTAQQHGELSEPRAGKTVYLGAITQQYENKEPVRIVFKIIERTITADGQHLLIPDLDVETFETSLDDDADIIINLYHDHATSEQFHSEIKTDIGLERLPSGRFDTNCRVMSLALLAFNLLRIIGQESLDFKGNPITNRHRIKRRRLRSVIQDLIYLAARLIRHARQWTLGFSHECPFYETFAHLYQKWAV
jgi:hypothetical protein